MKQLLFPPLYDCLRLNYNKGAAFPLFLIIEVMAPHHLRTDRVVNFHLHLKLGVKCYIMRDCKQETAAVFEFSGNIYKQVEKTPLKWAGIAK